jgi:hypothetical protein
LVLVDIILLPQKLPNYTIGANTFFANTTVLSHSVITSRGNTDLEDGGVSNTEDFSSLLASVDGENIANIEGSQNDRQYFTVSSVNRLHDNWLATVSCTGRYIDNNTASDVDDYLVQVLLGYDFGNGLMLEGGWRGTDEANVENNTVGALARYVVEF